MARQVLPWVGAAVGFMVGGPTGAQWGFAIGGLVGNAVDPQVISGPKLGEAGLQTSAEGVFRPIVFGKAAVMGNVICRGNRQVRTKRTRQSKGGGPVTEEQRVFWTFAIRICEATNPIAGVLRIWEDEKLVYDISPGSVIPSESAQYAQKFRLHLGGEDQLPDPDLEVFLGAGNVPAYRGTAYIVFPNMDLTDRRESIPSFRIEVATAASSETPNSVMALGTTSVLNFRTVNSPDGEDWSATPQLISSGQTRLLALSNGRFLSYSPAVAQYSDDFGATWTESDGGIGGYGGSRDACHKDGIILLPGAGNGIYRSTDNGQSFSAIPSSPYSNSIAIGSTLCISVANTTGDALYVWHSSDIGTTWNQGVAGDGFAVAGDFHIETDGSKFIVGAQKGGDPHLWVTSTGASISEISLTGSTGTRVTAIRNHGLNWLVGMDSGQLFYSVDGAASFVLSADAAPGDIRSIVHNGDQFVIGGGDTPFIAVTVDGADLSLATHPFEDDILDLAANRSIGLPSMTGQPFVLGDFVAAMHGLAGHDSSQIDVSELTDTVDGLVLAGDYTCGDAIRTLMPIYLFDASEHDSGTGYRIHYPKRGKPVVRTLTIDDLIDAPEKTTREDALERPRVLHLHYQSPAVGYAPAKATDKRDTPDLNVVGERSLQVPVVFEDQDEPRRIVRRAMKMVWTEAGGEEEFTVHDGHLDLVTADSIGVSLRGQVRRMRITQQWVGLGDIKLKLIPDRQSNVTANVTGVPLPAVTPPRPSVPGATQLAVMDIPALSDNLDNLHVVYGASGTTSAWHGALVQRKGASETEWGDATTFSINTIMGVLVDPVPAASEHYTDTTNTVRVELYTDDTIDAMTDAEFLSEEGAFAVENGDGTWELMQYRDVDDEGDRVFALTHLHRGRLNTGGSAHSAGARVVLLDGILAGPAISAWIGTAISHRAISSGTTSEGVAVQTESFAGRSQLEFPVAHLMGEVAGSTLSVSCVPRHRFGTDDSPVRSINWTGYRWTATDGANTATKDTTTDGTSFDVTGWSTPITVTVAQINRITGAGPTVTEMIA